MADLNAIVKKVYGAFKETDMMVSKGVIQDMLLRVAQETEKALRKESETTQKPEIPPYFSQIKASTQTPRNAGG